MVDSDRPNDIPAGKPTFRVPVAALRYTLQDLDIEHMFPTIDMHTAEGPICVSRLNDGNYFVHNGRHRAIRAALEGTMYLDAYSLYDNDKTYNGLGHQHV